MPGAAATPETGPAIMQSDGNSYGTSSRELLEQASEKPDAWFY